MNISEPLMIIEKKNSNAYLLDFEDKADNSQLL